MRKVTSGRKIKITGIVQGVGFRPFVYSMAQKYHLKGWVLNSSQGVEIEVSGLMEDIENFVSQVKSQPPPLARIDFLETEEIQPNHYKKFSILNSKPQAGEFVPISPDVSICKDCTRELFDPEDRRYRYPFINCTNCGPRFTIIRDIPYDRPFTTMSEFTMCNTCQNEYNDPLDRRFHAQPIACPECGPHLSFIGEKGKEFHKSDALREARAWLRSGKIVAIKGLGGYHLACDAANHAAVQELRKRKQRSQKPFASMAFDISTIDKHCFVDESEETLLLSRQRPIVLLHTRPTSTLSPLIAPNQNHLGMMLPYTPMHLLLMEPEEGYPEVLVMTSGNLSEEPIAYEDKEALERLSGIADGFLIHNRSIHMRTDDTVARIIYNTPYILRRSRGYAPDPLPLSFEPPSLLAVGTELKNTFTLSRNRYAFISHHIGDMENYETLRSFETGIQHYENIFKIKPEVIARDLHPDYLASKYAIKRAAEENIPIVNVQHHHAHLAACLCDNGWKMDEKKAIGIIFDGTGLGTDKTIWGGEILYGNYAGFERKHHLQTMPLPGGDAAIRNPARTSLAYLWQLGIDWGEDISSVKRLDLNERSLLEKQLQGRINTIETSSMGRLFDVVSSLLNICHETSYEGQAAIELENIAAPDEHDNYTIPIKDQILDIAPLMHSILKEAKSGVKVAAISARFHNSIVQAIVQACIQIRAETGCSEVALSGGVWQNVYLLNKTIKMLTENDFTVLRHRGVPPNDGGVSLGQLAVAAAMLITR